MKKLVLLILVTFVSLSFVGCGSSGSSSTATLEDTLLSAVKDKTVDLDFDISLSNSFAASIRAAGLRGDTTPFNLASATVTVYKFENGARVSTVYYSFQASDITPNDSAIRATLSLNADKEMLKALLLAENYEIVVTIADNPILKSLFTITTQQKINAISGDEIACNVNPDSTAKAMLFEKMKADDATVTFSNFLSNFNESQIASLTLQIETLLSSGINIYNGAEFANSINQYLTQAVHAFQQRGQLYSIAGTVSGTGLVGTGTTIIYDLRVEDASTGEIVQGDLSYAVLTGSSINYLLTLPAGSYKIKVFTDPGNELRYESTTLTVPQNADEGLTHDIIIP
ncbi:MAG: hypothetical protein PHF29_00510 [Candidatus Riflebacteria bacterium]|nr:hypothetical protein [Candidatus Riflebacteria bacterium]